MRRFAYRLALRLGHVNVKAMLRQINVRELGEWRAYSDLEPWDEGRADLRTAQVVQALFNVNRVKGPRLKLKDCLLRFKEDDEVQSPEQARAQVKATMDVLTAMFGEKPKKPRSRSAGE